MSLPAWSAEGRLRTHQRRRSEIVALLAASDRDLEDLLTSGLSPDRRFAITYGAALGLATIALHASGYRSVDAGHYEITVKALPHTLGQAQATRTRYLDACRIKRNRSDYDGIGYASDRDAEELAAEVRTLRADVLDGLGSRHPDLKP